MTASNHSVLNDLRAKLNKKMNKVTSMTEDYQKYRRNVALSAENFRTGKAIPVKVYQTAAATIDVSKLPLYPNSTFYLFY
jgi:hypothetical protein